MRGVFASHGRLLSVLVLIIGATLGASTQSATAAPGDEAARAERCAVRLSIAIFGTSPPSELLSDPNPRRQVDAMVESPLFYERFARFLNATFNAGPGQTEADDAVYFLAKHVLTKRLPYEELFLGKWRVDQQADGHAAVVADPDGLGFFRSPVWLRRYAGNEAAGYKITTGYRILNNTVGLELTAMTNVPGADVSATGRMASPCKGCHNDGWFALDRVAKVLTRRKGLGAQMTFEPPSEGPQTIADAEVSDDRSLVETLVRSDSFRFNACRLAFRFLTGRAENACEAATFDACMTSFGQTGMIPSAVAAVAKDEGFCQ